MEWKSIEINIQNIKKDTGNAVLIAMPHKSDYDGFAFWHPAKLVRFGSHSYARKISYTDDFKFKLKKTNKNFETIDEKEISASEIETAFNQAEN